MTDKQEQLGQALRPLPREKLHALWRARGRSDEELPALERKYWTEVAVPYIQSLKGADYRDSLRDLTADYWGPKPTGDAWDYALGEIANKTDLGRVAASMAKGITGESVPEVQPPGDLAAAIGDTAKDVVGLAQWAPVGMGRKLAAGAAAKGAQALSKALRFGSNMPIDPAVNAAAKVAPAMAEEISTEDMNLGKVGQQAVGRTAVDAAGLAALGVAAKGGKALYEKALEKAAPNYWPFKEAPFSGSVPPEPPPSIGGAASGPTPKGPPGGFGSGPSAEEKAQAQAEASRRAEKQARKEAREEAKRQAEAAKKQAEAARKKAQEQARRTAADAEAKRQAEAARKAAEEARRKAEASSGGSKLPGAGKRGSLDWLKKSGVVPAQMYLTFTNQRAWKKYEETAIGAGLSASELATMRAYRDAVVKQSREWLAKGRPLPEIIDRLAKAGMLAAPLAAIPKEDMDLGGVGAY